MGFIDLRALGDDELRDWCLQRIELRSPESDVLDYKREFGDFAKGSVKLELAKDISSFANERGGVLIYGVPEEKSEGVPSPRTLEECGVDLKPGVLEQINSILTDSIEPVLPELHIRACPLPDKAGKHLVVVSHPPSWNAPHMVSARQHGRYYRRNNFEAAPMSERSVEAAYDRRRNVRASAVTFFTSADNGNTTGIAIRLAIYPHLGTAGNTAINDPAARKRIENQLDPMGRRGSWLPFLDGWRFASHPTGGVNGRQYEIRLFNNGALVYGCDAEKRFGLVEENRLRLDYVPEVIHTAIRLAHASFNERRIAGPVSIQFELLRGEGMSPGDESNTWRSAFHDAMMPLSARATAFIEETSASELGNNAGELGTRLMDRLGAAFGVERIP